MLKRLFLFLLVFASLAVIAYTFYQNEQRPEIRHDIASAIPEDAALLIESDNLSTLWSRLNEGNLIWEEIGFTEVVKDINLIGNALDTALFSNADLKTYLKQTYHSMHLGAGRDVHGLTVFVLKKELTHKRVQSFIVKHIKPSASFRDKEYDGATISAIDSSGHCFSSYEGFLLFSDSQVLLERSIRSINENEGLADDPGFDVIRQTSGSNREAYLYVNHERIGALMNTLRDRPGKGPFFEQFAGWGEYDISLKTNAVMMTGMLTASDSLSDYLSIFEGQGAVDLDICDYLPSTTAEFVLMGITDKDEFERRHANYLQRIGQYNDKQKALQTVLKNSGLHQEDLLESMTDQALVGRLESRGEEENVFAILPITEENELTKSPLFDWSNEYREIPMSSPLDGRFLELSFGRFFRPLRKGVAAKFEDLLFVAENEKTLKALIDFNLSGRTLGEGEAFQNFLKTLSDEASLTYYLDPGRSIGLLGDRAEADLSAEIKKQSDVMKQFQGLCIQYEHARGDLYYQNLYFNHNPVYKKETASLWEVQLENTFSDKIWAVKNHRSGQRETFLQDDANQIHLLSNTGKRLWNRQLDETIRSEVEQVDMYNNGRLQLLFNTDSRIYLIDRLGRDVEGYPINLPAKATSTLAIMDYDKNKKYRLLIGTQEGMLHNFDVTGKAVKGWKYGMRGAPIIGSIRHFTIGSKDYISCVDSKGNLVYLDRAGEIRHDATQEMTDYAGGRYMIRTGKDISSTQLSYLRTDGDLWTMSSDGDDMKKSMALDSTKQVAWNRSAKLFLLDGNNWVSYDGLNGGKTTYKMGERCERLQLVDTETETWVIGQSSKTNNTYLYTDEGDPVSGFPINGSSRVVIKDMDGDGKSDLLIGDEDGVLYMYSLSL